MANGQDKPCKFTISFELCTLFQKWYRKLIIPLNYWLTGHPENFKKLSNYNLLFPRKIKSSI